MSFMKRLFDVRNVRTILVLASVFGIIFLSWMMIDKDDSIAQTKQYEASSYIKIDGSQITRMVGIQSNDDTVRQALEKRRQNGRFTLIEINVGGRSLYILASDVCVAKQLQDPIEKKYIVPLGTGTPIGDQLNTLNQGQNDTLHLEVPYNSCYKLNSKWI